jgi:sugar phosphate isomerase/epimerase
MGLYERHRRVSYGQSCRPLVVRQASAKQECGMKFAMCNEFCEGLSLPEVCALAVRAGYQGIELAPFTLAPSVLDLDAQRRREIRATITDHGLAVVGLHWLLVSPVGLSLSSPDAALRRRTRDYFEALIHCCGDLGGDRMIIGSPKQRQIPVGGNYAETFDRVAEAFQYLSPIAGQRGVYLGMEPLGRVETNFLNTVAETQHLVRAVNHPYFQMTLDCKAMSDEDRAIPDILRSARGQIAHFHANDPNRSYPGSGNLDFCPIMAALTEIKYDGWVSIEVFDFTPGAERIATEGLAALQAAMPGQG